MSSSFLSAAAERTERTALRREVKLVKLRLSEVKLVKCSIAAS